MRAAGMLLWPNLRLAAQDIDSIVGPANRSPTTIAEDIKDPAEKSAFVNLLKATDPGKILAHSALVSPEVSPVRVSRRSCRGGSAFKL